MAAALVCLLILVRTVVAALRRADMLTGDVNEDRRRVLSTLASLGLASLTVAGESPDADPFRTFARPIWRRARPSVGYQRDLADASMMVMSTRVFHCSETAQPAAAGGRGDTEHRKALRDVCRG